MTFLRLHIFGRRRFYALICAFAAWTGAKAARAENPVKIAPHKAVYDWSLYETKGGALSVVAASGSLTYEVRKNCDSYETKTHSDLTVAYDINGVEKSSFRQETKESADGCFFEFKSWSDESETPDVAGIGVCEADKKKITLTHPLPAEMALPRSVLFPVAQTKALLQAAADGKKIFSSYVYDASKADSLHFVNAVASEADENGDRLFNLAFYNDMGAKDGNDGSPLYEADVRYGATGAASEVVQRFDGYTLKSTLKSLETLPETPCAKKKTVKALKKTGKRAITVPKAKKGHKKGA